MLNFSALVLSVSIIFAQNSYASIQCGRTETTNCGIDALYTSKVFRESVTAALGQKYDPRETPKKARIHDGGWASYKLGQNEIDFAKRNKLPESYFKKTQWIMVEVSGMNNLLKTFQVDLDFQAYSPESNSADYKTATVENARVTELEPYRLEEEKQRALAGKMPVNGFVCETEGLGIIVRGEPIKNPLSFGQTIDSGLISAKEGKSETDLGIYRLSISDFTNKRPPTLPPVVREVEVDMSFSLDYQKGNPDKYDLVFVANSPNFSFWRALSGYNNTQKYCNVTKGKERAEVCETDPHEAIEVKTQDKKWDKVACHFYEKSAFAR